MRNALLLWQCAWKLLDKSTASNTIFPSGIWEGLGNNMMETQPPCCLFYFCNVCHSCLTPWSGKCEDTHTHTPPTSTAMLKYFTGQADWAFRRLCVNRNLDAGINVQEPICNAGASLLNVTGRCKKPETDAKYWATAQSHCKPTCTIELYHTKHSYKADITGAHTRPPPQLFSGKSFNPSDIIPVI